ncbi:MAG: murein L,D-transpeptidase [Aestuariivirga sp.]
MNWLARFLAAAVLLCVAAIPASAQKGDRAITYGDVQDAVAQILTSQERLELPLERIRAALKAHYVDNQGTVYWVGSGRMTPFLQRLARAEDDGLNPEDYPVDALARLRDSLTSTDPFAAAKAELYYSAFFVAYAADLKIGRVTPQRVDPYLFRSRKTIDVLRVLTDLKKQRDPGKFLSAFEPKNQHYQTLKKMLKLYRSIAGAGSWPTVGQGANVKPGQSDPRIPQIRRVLTMTGDYAGGGGSAAYDEGLAAAMRQFQQRHGLEAKGLIGKQTIVALNVPPAERARQIMLNMERWRWMPENMGSDHFTVNIAAFELQRVQSAEIVSRMGVVVGAVATQTPEFTDEVEFVELNPTWTVPYSIATKEMLPKLRQSRFAYAEDFDVFMNGKLVDWGSINWASYGPGTFPFTFRQRPGPKNALGKVKFMFPNKHNIYLHDTPAKDKFASTTRAFSHGCIRLSRPLDLAYELLGSELGMSPGAVDDVIANGATKRINLPQRIPIHLIYATAFKGQNGIEFRPDVYGRDRKLYNALFGKPTS